MQGPASQGIQGKAPGVTAQVQHPFALSQLTYGKPAVPLVCIEACLLPCAGGHQEPHAVLGDLHNTVTRNMSCLALTFGMQDAANCTRETRSASLTDINNHPPANGHLPMNSHTKHTAAGVLACKVICNAFIGDHQHLMCDQHSCTMLAVDYTCCGLPTIPKKSPGASVAHFACQLLTWRKYIAACK